MTYHLAGDSTVAACRPEEHPMSGWGAHLARHLQTPVRNLAFGGATTATFLAGPWDELLGELRQGDTVLVQFGHNDQKVLELGARNGYTSNLRHMVERIQQHGATAVLCTPCERRFFTGGAVEPTHGDYPNAVRDLAADMSTPLLDLTAFTTWLYEQAGPEDSAAYFTHLTPGTHAHWPEGLRDNTHFNETGAQAIAAFVAQGLRALERRGGDRPAKGSPHLA